MTLIAINVLLNPDAATFEKAQATNARLRENYPDGFALDANHAPHITLLQRFVRTADLRQGAGLPWRPEGQQRQVAARWQQLRPAYYTQSAGRAVLGHDPLRYRDPLFY